MKAIGLQQDWFCYIGTRIGTQSALKSGKKIPQKIREITVLHEKKLQYKYIFTNFLQSGLEITDFVVYARAHSDRPNRENL